VVECEGRVTAPAHFFYRDCLQKRDALIITARDAEQDMLITLTADIVAAHVTNNSVSVSNLADRSIVINVPSWQIARQHVELERRD